jgi:hypothetical protein
MLFLLIGDSNLRETYLRYKDNLKEDLEDITVIFEQATNNESIKLALEKERDPKPDLFYISTILNEITKNTGKGKPTEGIIKTITEDQNVIINSAAGLQENSSRLYLQCYPMLRQDPKWMEEKLLQIKFYMKEQHTIYSPANVCIVGEPIIEASDLSTDKTHLNEEGQRKFYEKIKADLIEGKEEIAKFIDFGNDWSNVELSQKLSQKTPKTAKKRQRTEDIDMDTTQENSPKKKKDGKEEEETVMSILKSFMAEIKEDRKNSTKKTEELEESIDKLKESEIEIRQEMQVLKGKKQTDITFTATLREDMDAIENESLRGVVIIKKLKTKQRTSADKTEMNKIAQEEGRKLVKEILGSEDQISYIGLLPTNGKPLRMTVGMVPPFKIAFKSKEKGIAFKEQMVQKSKDPTDPAHKSYVTSQQCMATRIRTNLMWNVVDKIKDQEKGIDAWVNQSLNKPTLQVKGEEKNLQSHSFVTAMAKYKTKLDQKAKDEASKMARKFYPGQVEKIFIVIKD